MDFLRITVDELSQATSIEAEEGRVIISTYCDHSHDPEIGSYDVSIRGEHDTKDFSFCSGCNENPSGIEGFVSVERELPAHVSHGVLAAHPNLHTLSDAKQLAPVIELAKGLI